MKWIGLCYSFTVTILWLEVWIVVSGSEAANSHSLNSSQLRARLEALVAPLDHPYEEVRLPPPRQFRDVPPPPEQFRDPPLPVDNLLYHVYESVRGRRGEQTNGHTEIRPP